MLELSIEVVKFLQSWKIYLEKGIVVSVTRQLAAGSRIAKVIECSVWSISLPCRW